MSPKEQQIDAYIVWIQKIGGAISTRGRNKDPEVIKKEIKDQEVCQVIDFSNYQPTNSLT